MASRPNGQTAIIIWDRDGVNDFRAPFVDSHFKRVLIKHYA